jgi:uncharacterized membrane protein
MLEWLRERRIHNEANILLFTAILSFVGIIFAAYLTYDHFYPIQQPICIPGSWLDCGKVLHGPYNNVLGIPFAILGLIGFVIVFLFSVIRLAHWGRDYTKNFFLVVLLFAFFGAVVSWYLTYLELFVIYAICPFCFTCFILITIILREEES